ncbi:Gfo/Idh/MocA family protein [Streptomyces griseoflavus]|uniref:Gfo/Idh/MocA family protein n=1 Tax=Streptomyces griseoflavus TaxID=35619 RepID=UPI003D720E6E
MGEIGRVLREGRFGRLRDGQSRFAFRTPEPGGYRLRPDLGGGIFHDVASYWLQALQERVGPPSSGGTGTAWCAERHGVDDAFEAVPPLPDGATATLTCSFAAQHLFHLDEARVRVRGVLLPAASRSC